jgi:hypothetical protein
MPRKPKTVTVDHNLQVYIDQLKGTIAQQERTIAKLRASTDCFETINEALEQACLGELTAAFVDTLSTADCLTQADTLRDLVRALTPTQTETLLSVIAGA